MSSDKNHREPKNYDELLDEARGALKPDAIDWEKLDEALFARIEAESKLHATTSGVRKSGLSRSDRFGSDPNRTWQIVGVFATAAAIALALHRPTSRSDVGFQTGSQHGAGTHVAALTLTAPGAGDVRIGGEIAAAGRSVRALDTIDTNASSAEFSSLAMLGSSSSEGAGASNDDALRAAWRLEDHSHVTVGSLGGGGSPLILELSAGALEAQVTPVERGEAFAVDLRGTASGGDHDVVRIAVHGTHLRVARDQNKATIDLSEGVVSIGFPPKSGSTYGMLVTAPAHVEIDIARFLVEGPNAKVSTAVAVDKNPGAVRAAVALTTHAAPSAVAAAHDLPENTEPIAAQSADSVANPNVTGEIVPNENGHAPSALHVSPSVDPHAEQTIIAAAQACAAVHQTAAHESSNEVRVTVSSKLTLHVGPEGAVHMARFEPPLTPEAQECAGKTIYKVRFAPAAAARDVEVPVEVQ